MSITNIEWTDRVWNPVTGCQKVSPGCKHCYAEGVAHRFWATQYPQVPVGPSLPDGGPTAWRDRQFTDVLTHEDRLLEPLSWKKPSRVFVNSMSDLFHEDVPDGFIDEVFATMAAGHRHTYQVLTKRPERMRAYMSAADLEERIHWASLNRFGHTPDFDPSVDSWTTGRWPLPNVWLGVSVEDQQRADERIPLLLQTPAAVRFISAEPLLGPIDLEVVPIPAPGADVYGLRGVAQPLTEKDAEPDDWKYWTRHSAKLDWVIVGGESGPGARPCHEAWVRSIVQQCQAAGTPVFVKQLGAFPIWSLSDGRPANGEGGTAKAARTVAGALNPKCADPSEWPEDLRVREFPR